MDPHNLQIPKSNINRTCGYEGCTKRASFGMHLGGKPSRCNEHKTHQMVSHDPRCCSHPGCKKRPNYSVPMGRRIPTHCVEHKSDEMVSSDKRICQDPAGCRRRARFADPSHQKPSFCLVHRQSGMVNVTRQVCQQSGCIKYPCYGYPSDNKNEKKITHCVQHHLPGMVNVKQKMCTVPMCTAYSHNPRETKGMCTRCFAYSFPEARQSKRLKTKETLTYEYLSSTFQDMTFLKDQIVAGGCSKYRPDILCDMLTHTVIVEIDEHQHESYDAVCENKRVATLWQDLAHRPLVLIRFNPDSYQNGNTGLRTTSCFRYNRANGMPYVPANKTLEWSQRLEKLASAVCHAKMTVPHKSITVHHLFYDGYGPDA